jgi:erythromycin esterase
MAAITFYTEKHPDMKQLYVLTLILLTCTGQGCRNQEHMLADRLNEAIRPLPPGSPREYENQLLEGLLPWEEYSVIGLGEATHGTMDFFELKQRLFRFLAEEHGCRILAYEYSFRRSLYINDYIHHKHDSLGALFRGDLWIQDNETVRQFISWMRDYNDGRSENEQLNFIGIDNQVDALKLEEVLEQLSHYVPAMNLDTEMFPYNLPGKKEVRYEDMTASEYDAIKQAMLQMQDQVRSRVLPLEDPGWQSDGRVALELVRSLLDSHEFLYLLFSEGTNIRDRQLAENVLRIRQASGGSDPVAVWAHNAHVACNPHYSANGSPAMGWYLRDTLKAGYLSVATSFSGGAFTAVMLDSAGNDTPPMTCRISGDPPEESVNALLHRARYPQFTLNIRDLNTDNPLYRYLNEERPMIGVGDLYLGSPELHFTDDRIINLVRAHDLLFYYNQTRPLL